MYSEMTCRAMFRLQEACAVDYLRVSNAMSMAGISHENRLRKHAGVKDANEGKYKEPVRARLSPRSVLVRLSDLKTADQSIDDVAIVDGDL